MTEHMIDKVQAMLVENRLSIVRSLSSGSVKDWDSYKYVVGQLSAFDFIENYINDLIRQSSE